MKKDWIIQGYKTFATTGPQGLKIERLAKALQKNKSSFYHYFSDMEWFIEQLLDYHLAQVKTISQKEAASRNLDELIAVMVAHKMDLLFNRQLRIHRTIPHYQNCFHKTDAITETAIGHVWAQVLGLTHLPHIANMVLKLGLDNFYLQITEDNLNPTWIKQYFASFSDLVKAFKRAKNLTPLNGSV
ncbi:MAG: TetR/AcrR family transcriptional regulator [Bacteroidota bacterium]